MFSSDIGISPNANIMNSDSIKDKHPNINVIIEPIGFDIEYALALSFSKLLFLIIGSTGSI